jgi:hypothetical protein
MLSLQDIAATPEMIFGPSGTVIIALLIIVTAFSCNNRLILTRARVYDDGKNVFLPMQEA